VDHYEAALEEARPLPAALDVVLEAVRERERYIRYQSVDHDLLGQVARAELIAMLEALREGG